MVDQTFNSDFPCQYASIAAASADSTHSGAKQAQSKIVTFDTTGLSTSIVFAVCYLESGTAWKDSGVRFTISKISTIQWGTYSTSNPIRVMTSTNVAAATNRLPQVANAAVLTYVGDLATGKFISLVDQTITGLNGNDPCVSGLTAAAPADQVHSGPLAAPAGTKAVTVPQNILLDETKTFAVCYAETSGNTTDTTWNDSYIRVQISKLHSISAHQVTHVTIGQIAKVPNSYPALMLPSSQPYPEPYPYITPQPYSNQDEPWP